MTKLWLYSYEVLNGTEIGEEIAYLLENVYYSAIGDLRDRYTTQSKAGWIAAYEEPAETEEGEEETNVILRYYSSSNDAGIIYSDKGPYVMVILSDIPSSLERITPLVNVLDEVHQEMVSSQ